ncbi:hypothetical protein [Amycolatopsis sp. NPDC098790]|uniref:hypothetical protein n=1 Tax=Amycolatopsis sp. NPDC098790 TaxID=3363939 RepID=UPI00380A69C6
MRRRKLGPRSPGADPCATCRRTDRAVELTRSVYRGDRYRITSKLRFDAESG